MNHVVLAVAICADAAVDTTKDPFVKRRTVKDVLLYRQLYSASDIWLSQSWHQPPHAVVPSPVAPQSSHVSIVLFIAQE